MRKMLAVAEVSLLKTWKDKLFVIIMIATALVFTSVAGLIFGGSSGGVTSLVPVGVTDNDGSELSTALTGALESAGAYKVHVLSEEAAYEDVRLGKVETAFVIPAGFQASVDAGTPKPVTVVSLSSSTTGMVAGTIMEKSLTSYLLEQAVVSVTNDGAEELGLTGKVDAYLAAENAVEKLKTSPALTVEFEAVAPETDLKDAPNWTAGYAGGVYIMFTMFTVLFQAGDILNERQLGTWGRLISTPVSRSALVGGKAIGAYVVGLLQIIILVLAGRFAFKINFGQDLLGVLAIMALMVAVVTAMGLFLSTLVRTTAQLQTMAPIVIVATCMLGGCYWSLEMVSPTMRTVSKFTPQAWAMTALNDVVLRGRSLSSTAPNLLVLACFGLVFFVLGVWRTKFE